MSVRNRGWVWFFVLLAALTVTSITILWAFNRHQQLTPQRLAENRAKWEEKGPRDYNLKYTEEGRISGTFEVRVRHGQVVYAEPDERPLEQKRAYYGMPALFGFIEDFLRLDAEPGKPRSFTVAYFDPVDGHVIQYVRSVMGTGDSLEIKVQLERDPEETPAADTSPDKTEAPARGPVDSSVDSRHF